MLATPYCPRDVVGTEFFIRGHRSGQPCDVHTGLLCRHDGRLVSAGTTRPAPDTVRPARTYRAGTPGRRVVRVRARFAAADSPTPRVVLATVRSLLFRRATRRDHSRDSTRLAARDSVRSPRPRPDPVARPKTLTQHIMTWQPVDCHAHSTFSDGALSVAAGGRARQAVGRPSVASPTTSRATSAQSIKSVDEVAPLPRRARATTTSCAAASSAGTTHLWRELPADLVRRFTHRLGSLHAVRMPDGSLVHAFSSRASPTGLTVDAYMDAHIASLEAFAREMPVDILAHPTLVTLAVPRRSTSTSCGPRSARREWSKRCSTPASHSRSRRAIRPHERLVQRAVERGVRISLGSDGHTFDQVADVAGRWRSRARSALPTTICTTRERHGSKTGDGARGAT